MRYSYKAVHEWVSVTQCSQCPFLTVSISHHQCPPFLSRLPPLSFPVYLRVRHTLVLSQSQICTSQILRSDTQTDQVSGSDTQRMRSDMRHSGLLLRSQCSFASETSNPPWISLRTGFLDEGQCEPAWKLLSSEIQATAEAPNLASFYTTNTLVLVMPVYLQT